MRIDLVKFQPMKIKQTYNIKIHSVEGKFMLDLESQIKKDLAAVVLEWTESGYLKQGDLFVIGCSTSEVAGEHIGTSGSEQIGQFIFETLEDLKSQTGIQLVFQCCEHLNRALVVERETMIHHKLEEVSVIPQPHAGGSMATYAFKHFKDPVMVETIQADAGIDIGETMIGMQLKPVVVPLRFNQRTIGHARITGARTRPKLIGGERATY